MPFAFTAATKRIRWAFVVKRKMCGKKVQSLNLMLSYRGPKRMAMVKLVVQKRHALKRVNWTLKVAVVWRLP